jgi:hypothetical protein
LTEVIATVAAVVAPMVTVPVWTFLMTAARAERLHAMPKARTRGTSHLREAFI